MGLIPEICSIKTILILGIIAVTGVALFLRGQRPGNKTACKKSP